MQGYHIFPNTRDVYLHKNHYENRSPQMVPMTKQCGAMVHRGLCHNYSHYVVTACNKKQL